MDQAGASACGILMAGRVWDFFCECLGIGVGSEIYPGSGRASPYEDVSGRIQSFAGQERGAIRRTFSLVTRLPATLRGAGRWTIFPGVPFHSTPGYVRVVPAGTLEYEVSCLQGLRSGHRSRDFGIRCPCLAVVSTKAVSFRYEHRRIWTARRDRPCLGIVPHRRPSTFGAEAFPKRSSAVVAMASARGMVMDFAPAGTMATVRQVFP